MQTILFSQLGNWLREEVVVSRTAIHVYWIGIVLMTIAAVIAGGVLR